MIQKIQILLPETVYILRDRPNQTVPVDREEYQIYFQNTVVPYSETYDIQVCCDYGKNYGDFWRIDEFPVSGGFSLTIQVFDAGECLGEKTVRMVPVEKKRHSQPFSVLCIGDSMTRAGIYLSHIAEKLNGIRFVGSRTYNGSLCHEGRGGWSLSDYLTRYWFRGGVSPFLFPGQVSGAQYFGDMAYFNALCRDCAGDYDLEGFSMPEIQEGQVFYQDGRLFCQEKEGARRLDAEPDFSFDFEKYLTRFGIQRPDAVSILLGANDFQRCTYREAEARITRFMEDLSVMISGIRRAGEDTAVILNLPVPGAEQYAWGEAAGCAGSAKQYRRVIQRLTERLLRKWDRPDAGVFLSPMHMNLDPVYGFPRKMEPVNRYSEAARSCHSNWLHPCDAGYRQMGDMLAGVLEYLSQRRDNVVPGCLQGRSEPGVSRGGTAEPGGSHGETCRRDA